MRIVLEVETPDDMDDGDVEDLMGEIEEGLSDAGITATAMLEDDEG